MMTKFEKIKDSYLINEKDHEGKIKVWLWMLILFSIYGLLIKFSIIFLLLIPLATFYLVTRNATVFDIENKRMKTARIFKSYGNGKWKSLPPIEYVSVFKTNLISTTHSISYREIILKQQTIMINLIHDKNKKITIYRTFDESESLDIAKKIAHHFNIPIYNAISNQRNWIYK